MKKIFSLLLAAIMIVGSFSLASAKTESDTRAGIGMSVAGFNAEYLLSDEVFDSSTIGEYDLTFINYWATWCGPCVSEMPHIRTMYNHFEETPELDVQVIGAVSISGSCTEQSATQFLNQNGYNWPNVVPDSILRAVFNTSSYIPQTLIVDSRGVVRDHIVGSFSNYNQLLNCVNMWLDVFASHDDETVTVSYVCDANGEVFHTEEIPYGAEIPTPNSSWLPEVEGYTFGNWTYNDPNIYETAYEPVVYLAMGDCTITAHYNVRRYLVRFYDSFNGHIISSQQVDHGSAANPPADPDHEDEGCFFLGWDRDFNCITEQTFIYSVIRYRGDIDDDGEVTVTDSIMILRMAMDLIPGGAEQYADFDGDGEISVSDALMCLRCAMGV